MSSLLAVWGALLLALVIFAIGKPGKAGALTLAYFLGLSLIHVPGVLPFLGSGFGLGDADETQIGFEMTILGMAAFVAGGILARPRDHRIAGPMETLPLRRAKAFERLGWRMLTVGVVTYFVLIPLSSRVYSATSIVSSMGTLLILGLWLALDSASLTANRRRTAATLTLLPLLPLATLVSGGFLGYGVYWVLSVVAFLFVITRRRIWFYLSTPFVLFLGLSLFVAYMGQRSDIRELEWQEHAGLFDRLYRVSAIATEFELFDLTSPEQAETLDSRLNQNWLVGAAVQYHGDGFASFAYGATIPLWALVPRAVWPGKPEVGGGGEVVSNFTGISFAEGTSVGSGQVLEFYVNFGIPGLLIGFFCLGWLLMRLDQGIMRALASGDMRGLLLRAMPGLMLLQPGGNLLEIVVGCVAAYVSAHLLSSLRFFNVSFPARSRRLAA